MRRTAIISFVMAAALFAVCAAWPVCSVAEPIGQNDLAASPAAATTTQEMPEVKDAADKFSHRDVDGAVKLLKEAAKKNSELPPAWVIIAQWFLQTNNGQAAHNALERATVDTPNDPEAYSILGQNAIQQRAVAEARLLYEKANGLMAGFNGGAKRKMALQSSITSGLAMTDELRENWAAAQKELEDLLKLDPKSTATNAAALQQLAQCLFQQKDVDGALARLKEAAKLDPSILTPEATIALYYHAAHDEKQEVIAQQWMVKALTAAPRDLNTRIVAAQWAWETNQLEVAKKQAAAALQLDAKSLKAKLLCGLIALFQKDYKAAEDYFESAFNQAPKEYGASNDLALALIEQDEAKRDKALQYAETNVRQYPKWPEGHSTYGWVLYKLGRLDEAVRELDTSLNLSGGAFDADNAYYRARVLADLGKRDNNPQQLANARRLLEDALRTTAPFAKRDEAKELLQQLPKPAEKPAEKVPDKPAEQPAK
jgi:tetratricopeptide (TPR) repeat protein